MESCTCRVPITPKDNVDSNVTEVENEFFSPLSALKKMYPSENFEDKFRIGGLPSWAQKKVMYRLIVDVLVSKKKNEI